MGSSCLKFKTLNSDLFATLFLNSLIGHHHHSEEEPNYRPLSYSHFSKNRKSCSFQLLYSFLYGHTYQSAWHQLIFPKSTALWTNMSKKYEDKNDDLIFIYSQMYWNLDLSNWAQIWYIKFTESHASFCLDDNGWIHTFIALSFCIIGFSCSACHYTLLA